MPAGDPVAAADNYMVIAAVDIVEVAHESRAAVAGGCTTRALAPALALFGPAAAENNCKRAGQPDELVVELVHSVPALEAVADARLRIDFCTARNHRAHEQPQHVGEQTLQASTKDQDFDDHFPVAKQLETAIDFGCPVPSLAFSLGCWQTCDQLANCQMYLAD